MTNATLPIDSTILNDFRPGYRDLFTQHCASEFGWDTDLAAAVITNAIRFIGICAIPPAGIEPLTETRMMISSPIVDKVVDTILLDTPLCMWLEQLFNGVRFVHVPAYAHGQTDPVMANLRYTMTIQLMQAAGYNIDNEIWPERLPVNSQTCHCGNDLDDCLMYAI